MASLVNETSFVSVGIDAQNHFEARPGDKYYWFYEGTTTAYPVYSDPDFVTPHTQPLVTDSLSMTPQYFLNPTNGNYKLRVTTAADVVVWERDNLSPGLTTPVAVTNGGTGATTAAAARTALDVPSTSVTDGHNTRITAVEAITGAPRVISWNAQTFAASFTPDFSSDEGVSTTLTADVTVNLPSSPTAGQDIYLRLTQDATGSREITFASGWNIPAQTKFSRSPNAIDHVRATVISSSEIQVISVTVEDAGYTDYDLGTLANATEYSQNHGLGEIPRAIQIFLENVTAQYDVVAGEWIEVTNSLTVQSNGNRYGCCAVLNDTQVKVRTANSGFYILDDAGTHSALTVANWKIILRVFR